MDNIIKENINMEYFDVLDKNRMPLGYKKLRGSTLEENEYNMGCEIYFVNNDKLLITQRCELKSHPLEWEVVGGCAKSGQTSIETILTEVKEELGIDINEKDIKLIDTKIYKKMFVDIYLSNKIVDLNKVKLQKEEVKDITYISFKEFEEMASKGQIVKSVYDRYIYLKEMRLK